MHGNKITGKGGRMLFEALNKYNISLPILNMGVNKLDDECMIMLGEYLHHNQTIVNINLGNNKITDTGVKAFFEKAAGNTSLKQLSLHCNIGITDDSVQSILSFIESSSIEIILTTSTSIKNPKVFLGPCIKNILSHGSSIMSFYGL